MKSKTMGFLWMALAAAGLATATILMKLIPENSGLTPAQVSAWRFSISAPLLWLLLGIRQPKAIKTPENPWKLLGLGLVYAVASLLALLSLERLPSSLYVIIVYTYPSLVVLYFLLTRQPVPRLWWLGVPLTLAGLVLAVFEVGQPLRVRPPALLLALANGLVIGLYNVLSARVFHKISDRFVGTVWMQTGAMFAGFALLSIVGISVPESPRGWLMVFSLSIFGTLIPILALNTGLQMVGAARGSLIMTLQPALAILFATLFLGDVFQPQQWLGGLLVVLAVVLLQRSPDQKPQQTSEPSG